MKLHFNLLIIVLIALLVSGCSSSNMNMPPKKMVTSYSEERVEVIYPFSIDIKGDYGNIEVYSWDKDEVKFEITRILRGMQSKEKLILMLEDYNMKICQEDEKLEFISEYIGSIKSPADKRVDLKVYIPKKTDSIDISLDTGTIKFFDDVRSKLDIKVNTVNVDINKIIGKLTMAADMCDLRISDGKLISGTSVRTNFGNMRIKTELEDNGQYDFFTNIGSIDLNLPKASSIDAEIDGNVRNNEFQQCFSGAKVKLKSGMGDINIKKVDSGQSTVESGDIP